jgi:hypothetical protein
MTEWSQRGAQEPKRSPENSNVSKYFTVTMYFYLRHKLRRAHLLTVTFFKRGHGMNGPERRKIQIFVGFQKFLQIQWFMEKSLSPKHPITIITTLQFK